MSENEKFLTSHYHIYTYINTYDTIYSKYHIMFHSAAQ